MTTRCDSFDAAQFGDAFVQSRVDARNPPRSVPPPAGPVISLVTFLGHDAISYFAGPSFSTWIFPPELYPLQQATFEEMTQPFPPLNWEHRFLFGPRPYANAATVATDLAYLANVFAIAEAAPWENKNWVKPSWEIVLVQPVASTWTISSQWRANHPDLPVEYYTHEVQRGATGLAAGINPVIPVRIVPLQCAVHHYETIIGPQPTGQGDIRFPVFVWTTPPLIIAGSFTLGQVHVDPVNRSTYPILISYPSAGGSAFSGADGLIYNGFGLPITLQQLPTPETAVRHGYPDVQPRYHELLDIALHDIQPRVQITTFGLGGNAFAASRRWLRNAGEQMGQIIPPG